MAEVWRAGKDGDSGSSPAQNSCVGPGAVCSSVGRDWASMQETVASTPDTTKIARPQSQYTGGGGRRNKRSRMSSTKCQVQGHSGLCLKTNKQKTREVAQLVKCLHQKREDLTSIHHTHVKKKLSAATETCNPSSGEMR